MPINNTKGLDALRALSEGGSPALDAYKQSQMKEQSSRTTALNNALGGQDVSQAVAAAQAKYSPKVPTGGIGVNDLAPAANQFLSQAADKLNAQNYEDQANLTLKSEALRRKQNQMSAEDLQNMLYGASDLMAENQKAKAAEALSTDPVTALANQKAAQRAQLTAFDQESQANAGLAQAALGGNPEAYAQLQAREQQRGDILRAMAATDEQYKQAADQYTGALGTDSAGLLQRYGTDNPAEVQGMLEFLAPQTGDALARSERAIDVGGQERLRQLAPAFGIDPLKAQGMFREGMGNDLSRVGQSQKESAYVSGAPTAGDRKQQDQELADALGFDSAKDYTTLRSKTRMSDDEIQSALQSPEWGTVNSLYEGALTGEVADGYEGFQSAVRDYANSLEKPAGVGEAQWKTHKAKLIQLANTYYKDPTKAAAVVD